MKIEQLTIKARTMARVTVAALVLALLAAFEARGCINIVGYANVGIANGYNFVANPLDFGGANGLNQVLSPPPASQMDGMEAYVWDTTNQIFLPPSTYSTNTSTWSINYPVPPGRGFVIRANAAWTNTFVGNVFPSPCQQATNILVGGNKFSLVASMLPVAGPLTNAGFQFPSADGQNVLLFDTASQSYQDAWIFFGGFGWFNPNAAPTNYAPFLNVGQSFFYQGPGTNWVQTLTNSPSALTMSQQKSLNSSTTAGPEISRISVSAGNVTLTILNPSSTAYNVEFSADGAAWSTVATNQTGTVWTAKRPGGVRGYYQVVNP